MKRHILFILLLGFTLLASAQKSKVMAVMQMIEAKSYEEARENIELAIQNDRTSNWARTYYAKGVLCQIAFEDGSKDGDVKKMRLYPDQLYVAYASFEKAIQLDVRERLFSSIGQYYYLLSNDFRKLGGELYVKQEYKEALRAFEHALLLNQSELIVVEVDTALIYNAAMSAYESKNWDKAVNYLTGLHEQALSPETTLLLASAYQQKGDTLSAELIMMEGMEIHNYEESLVMKLVNTLVEKKRLNEALDMLDLALFNHPENYKFLWAKGLIYRRMGSRDDAIVSFQEAIKYSPDNPILFYHLGVTHYNIGIDLRESALKVSDSREYRRIREQYRAQFEEAVIWLEKSYELDPENDKTVAKLYQLYYQLQMKEKQESLQLTID